MKTTLIVLFLFVAAAAFGQASSPSMSPLEFGDHSSHAGTSALATPTQILGGNGVYIEHGEVPLADIPLPKVHETPLGDVAREARKEHLTAKKAQKVWESQLYTPSIVQISR